ncbi:MAG: hypothetical protein IT463_07315 [Planctomycetes bacterium]|nr:hypothetical protein [Planctomycetota bacterium]
MGSHLFTLLDFGVFGWLAAGVALRRRRPLHAAMMTLGFAFDTALLLFIELDRGATGQLRGPMSGWMTAHVWVAGLMTLLWPTMLYLGGRASAGAPVKLHRLLGRLFLAGRFVLAGTAAMAVHAS